MKHSAYLLIVLAIAGATFASNQQLRRKMGNLYMNSQGRSILNIAAQSGADISKVTVRMQSRGRVVKLNGSVPSSNDYETIQMAAEMSGPFKDIRNFITVQPPSSDEGIVMRDMDYAPNDTVEHLKNGLKNCPVCQMGTPCYDLYQEHEKLEKELKDKYLMATSEQRNTYKMEAVKLTTRLKEIESYIDASLCYAVATGTISPEDAQIIIEEDE